MICTIPKNLRMAEKKFLLKIELEIEIEIENNDFLSFLINMRKNHNSFPLELSRILKFIPLSILVNSSII